MNTLDIVKTLLTSGVEHSAILKVIETLEASQPDAAADAPTMTDGPPIPERHRQIIDVVAQKHGVSIEAILGRNRSASIVAARWEAVRAVRNANPDMSVSEIGRLFNRDHTTILYALGLLNHSKRKVRARDWQRKARTSSPAIIVASSESRN